MNIVVLTTKTKHHIYFVNRLATEHDVHVVLETGTLNMGRLFWRWMAKTPFPSGLISNPYLHFPNPVFKSLEDKFEDQFFSHEIAPNWHNHRSLKSFVDVNTSGCINYINTICPEVIISFGVGIIRSGILAIPCTKMNVHRGIVPAYRGLDSDLWACYNHDFGNIGTTIHQLESRLDTGMVFRQGRIRIRPGMRAYHLRYHTTVLGTDLLLSALTEMDRCGHVVGWCQDINQGRYYSFIPPAQRLLAIYRMHDYTGSLKKPDSKSSRIRRVGLKGRALG